MVPAASAQSRLWTELWGTELEAVLTNEPAHVLVGSGAQPLTHDGIELYPETIRRGQQPFYFRVHPAHPVYNLSVSLDQGVTWQALFNGSLTTADVHWPTVPQVEGVYEVQVRTLEQFDDGIYLVEREFTLIVVPPAQRAFRYREYNHPFHQWRAVGDGFSAGPWPGNADNLILIWQNGALDRPVLVLEGIDASNSSSPTDYFALGVGLYQRMLAEGGDVAILGYGDGGRDLTENAAVATSAIQLLGAQRDDRRRGIDVVGLSMGGVVGRYALAKLEQDWGVNSHAALRFVSVDAPQQGAVIDRELQQFLRDERCEFGWEATCVRPSEWPLDLYSPAGQQLLQYNAFDTDAPTDHWLFYFNLRALNGGRGYPRVTSNIGVTFGTAPQNPGAGQEWAEIVNPIWFNPVLRVDANAGVVMGGSFLPEDMTGGWTRISGPIWAGLDREEGVNPTFIPYVSALDIRNGTSSFDVTFEPPVPGPHNRVPDGVKTPVLNRLGFEVPPPASATISGPSYVPGGQAGTFTASAPGFPAYGYAFQWETRKHCGIVLEAQDPTGTESAARGGGIGEPMPQGLPCGEWQFVGFRPTLSLAGQGTYDLRLTVLDNQGTVATTRVVTFGTQSLTEEGGDAESWLRAGDTPEAALAAAQGAATAAARPAEVAVADAATDGAAFGLESSVPNPVRVGGRAVVRFKLAGAGPVRLSVYDGLGREVAVLAEGAFEAGSHAAWFNAAGLAPGVYVARLTAGGAVASQRLLVAP